MSSDFSNTAGKKATVGMMEVFKFQIKIQLAATRPPTSGFVINLKTYTRHDFLNKKDINMEAHGPPFQKKKKPIQK